MARLWIGLALLAALVASAHAEPQARLEQLGTDGARRPLPMVASDLQVTVRGTIAQVHHLQRFVNESTTPIEALYTFPLPADAAVGAMTMRLDARTIRAQIARRAEARAAYAKARASGRTAALLEQERPNVFTQSVTGIRAGETIEVELVYDVLLAPVEGWYELALPTVVGPRYHPPQVADAARLSPPVQAPGTSPRTTFGFTLDLQPGAPVAEVDSPTHTLELVERDHDHLAIALATPEAVADKDVVVRWRVEVAEPTIALFAGAGADGDGYLTAIVQPPVLAAGSSTPRELVFVLDTSGSMSGEPLALEKQAIRYALERLGPGDRFRLINFSSDVGGFDGGAMVPVTVDNLRRAKSWLAGVGAGGGTEMLSGIRAALADPPTDGRRRYVCFLTDGFIGNEDEILAAIAQERAASTHLFSFGVGSSVNRFLLDEMARVGHGASQVILLDDAPQPQIARFFRQLVTPMWSDVVIELPGLGTTELTPSTGGDLFAGQPLVFAARYRGAARGAVRVLAKVDGKVVTLQQTMTLPATGGDGALLGRLWARQRIRELMAAQRLGDDKAIATITDLALAHALASPYTSFVAIDDLPRTPGQPRSTVPVPVELPEGLEYGAAIGTMYGSSAETISISGRAPMIDVGSTSNSYVIDSTTGFHEVAQPGRSSGLAGGELALGLGAGLDGGLASELRGGLRLRFPCGIEPGVDAGVTWRRGDAASFDLLAGITWRGLWSRLAMRLAAGVGARLDTAMPAAAWRAELRWPLAPQVELSLGLADLRHDGHAPAAFLGATLAF